MTQPEIQKDMIVINPKALQWGPGRVLEIAGPTARVYFRDAEGDTFGGAIKSVDMSHAPLVLAENQSDPFLEHLPVDHRGRIDPKRPRVSMQQAIRNFLVAYPLGFLDPAYIGDRHSGERAYKLAAHEVFETTLGDGQGEVLLAGDKIEEAARLALAVVARVNLLSLFENAAMRDGFKDLESAGRFLRALFDLISRDAPEQEPFERLVALAQELPAKVGKSSPNKWTIVTILPFLARPRAFPFLKPEATKHAADLLGFDLMYDATPNWRTYKLLLKLGDNLAVHLRANGLHPEDWIDLQSFMWLVTGDNLRTPQASTRMAGRTGNK
jgi:hypothetical protein